MLECLSDWASFHAAPESAQILCGEGSWEFACRHCHWHDPRAVGILVFLPHLPPAQCWALALTKFSTEVGSLVFS